MWVYIWTDESYYPTANTVLYFPFSSDANEHSWKNITLSNSGTQETIWRRFNNTVTMSASTSWLFGSMWIKVNSFGTSWSWSNYYDQIWLWQIVWSMNYQLFAMNSNERNVIYYWYWNKSSAKYNTWIVAWSWYHIVFYSDNNVWYTWINGVKHTIGNWTPYNWSATGDTLYNCYNTTNKSDITLSDVIVESRVWTDAEVLEYYNRTKWVYGL